MKRTSFLQVNGWVGLLSLLLLVLLLLPQSHSWSLIHVQQQQQRRRRGRPITAQRAPCNLDETPTSAPVSRRRFVTHNVLQAIVVATTTTAIMTTTPSATAAAAAAAPLSLTETVALIRQAREQLAPVPQLIQQEKWDSVRAILITPPLSDCWAKTGRPLLNGYAAALGDAGLDELAALEAREEAISHLRYLDMAVYSKFSDSQSKQQ